MGFGTYLEVRRYDNAPLLDCIVSDLELAIACFIQGEQTCILQQQAGPGPVEAVV